MFFPQFSRLTSYPRNPNLPNRPTQMNQMLAILIYRQGQTSFLPSKSLQGIKNSSFGFNISIIFDCESELLPLAEQVPHGKQKAAGCVVCCLRRTSILPEYLIGSRPKCKMIDNHNFH